MPASTATASYGTLLKQGDGAMSEAFTSITEVTNLSSPGMKLDLQEVTNMESPTAWREFIATLKDAGEVTVEFNGLPAETQQVALRTCLVNKTKRNFRITFTDSGPTTWNFSGFVTNFQYVPGDVNGALKGNATIKITGAMTFA